MSAPSPHRAPPPPLPPALVQQITAAVGPAGIVSDPALAEPYLEERRGLFRGASPLIVRPASTAEVAAVVRHCAAARVAIVPQGGNTGLVGGAVAHGEVLVNLGRMAAVRAIDAANYAITVEAGCVLADIQAAAAAYDRLFPLSLGAEGSCQIGGNLSTNAGGTAVLRYGNARELTLGLEVVLADGTVWDGLRGLRKDNRGYDMKHVFIGAEGTLGIITGAVLKLFPAPRGHHTAFVAMADLDAVLDLLSRARRASADTVTAFELIGRRALEFACRHDAGVTDPLADAAAHYVLIEFAASEAGSGLGAALEGMLADALDAGLVSDATIAQSEAQRRHLWRIREAIVEAQKFAGASIKNDVSVPVSQVPELIRRATVAVEAACPGIRPVPFGHVGDGNIHFNLSQPEGADGAAFLARWDELTGLVNAVMHDLGGSFSAEHGIGRLKRQELAQFKPAAELMLMRQVKAALDPHNIMNPGAVLPLEGTRP